MLVVSDDQFATLMSEAFERLPKVHRDAVENVAIVYADVPSEAQGARLRPGEVLLGLYEGVPLARRQGNTSYGPDKITLFKDAICARVSTLDELREQIYHTLWHEVAHYFGLDHDDIGKLDR